MDKDIEEMVMNCSNCQSTRPEAHSWETPSKPFDRVHADFAGPFMGQYYFILVDAFSKWPEVHVLPNITAETTIRKCREIFLTFALPITFVSYWGPQFMSSEFQEFLKLNGIHHKRGAPDHPSTNGQAERYVQTIKII
ncbi:uncharacterized protein K02A2.6-like [Eupeodes corollae]|uniref:uncharacterized protein K02A2.6-like n=1 Tax=Eupeodes corollae TaxID=290404 RepID=UPI0024926505|nr:uncharacterized protein K02A2.6-like [Eupeodes corollae]